MANITGVEAAGWDELHRYWWQYILVGFILLAVGLGSTFLLYLGLCKLYNDHIQGRVGSKQVPNDVRRYLSQSSADLSPYSIEKTTKRPNSYGVYLGAFETPPTSEQVRLLAEWDLLVFDPSQAGVLEAMSSGIYAISPQTIARLDVRHIARGSIHPISSIVQWIGRHVKVSAKITGHQHCFTGVLVSAWEEVITVPVLKAFIIFASGLGFTVYLEVSAPQFLVEPKLAELEEVTGLVLRNGTISANGEERDAFQMSQMRTTIKAFISQACLRSFVVLLWETLEDDASPLNAVMRRSYQWSSFYSALPWIGTKSALTSAELSLVQEEPLAAFDWLKELRVMKIHDKWRFNKICVSTISQESTEISSLTSRPSLERQTSRNQASAASSRSASNSLSSTSQSSIPLASPSWLNLLDQSAGNALSNSPRGGSYDYFGCFPLGFNVTRKAFADVVQAQQRLKGMILLDQIKNSQLKEIGEKLQQFCTTSTARGTRPAFEWLAVIQELAHQLSNLAESGSDDFLDPIRVYIGLDSGFQIQARSRFWGVYGFNDDGNLDIFLSRNVHDITGAILHTFLSSRGCSRHECFQTEVMFATWSGDLVEPLHLSQRMVDDLALLSPAELLKFLQHLTLTPGNGDSTIVSLVRAACEKQLLDGTDFAQLKEISTTGYLSGRATAADLVNARLHWYKQSGCQHPDPLIALHNFLRIDDSITLMLKHRNISSLQRLTDVLVKSIEDGIIDSRVDLIAFAVFCAMRKHAFDEAYIEVTDRNTLFNDQSDQAAAFAELFATGARCEAYFDLTPSAFGKMLSDRYRTYHHRPGYEPPIWSDLEPATPSAYAAAKIDVDPESKKSSMSAPQRFTFLSVFAIPALLDILLLTTTGRGLYLSSQMSHKVQHSATLALMLSLLISGAVGTWITCGGSYYLISMAFSAMNMFVITRLVGGLAFTLAIATVGLIAVGVLDGIGAGFVFFLYFVALTSYLTLLATLANFQYPGSAFQSGRPIIIMVIPFLFISPVMCMWVLHHDIYIYLVVIYTFLSLLVLGVRRTGSRWTTWYLAIEKINDQDLRKWYIKKYEDGDETAVSAMTEPGVLKLARDALYRDVTAVRRQWRMKSSDSVVLSLAKSYDATIFLLEWYSGYSGTPMPIPYSSTWNMQTKVALQTLKQLQTGIRLHNAFIHWRQAGDEVGCTILYFIVALLDKWSALLAGGQLLGLSSQNTRYRMPVGFALAYYLIGAVLLDFNAAKLHTMTAKGQNMLIGDVVSISEAVKREVRARRYLYWTMLGRYLLFHVWSMAVASTLLWVFDSTRDSTLLFLAYVAAYTGLLWYQYTKIFSGPRSLKPLIAAVLIALPLGQLLRHYFPKWMYCDVAALGVATWTAAILTLYYARIKTKSVYKTSKKPLISKQSSNKTAKDGNYHAFTNPGKDPLLSQDELRIVFNNLQALREEERYQIDPQTHPGLEIKSVLLHALGNCCDPRGALSKFSLEAFPDAGELLERAVFGFEHGSVVVDCIPMAAMSEAFGDVKAIARDKQGILRIVIGCEMMSVHEQQSSISNFCQTTAEVILHAVAERFMGMTHESATLAESFLVPVPTYHIARHSPVPSRVKNYLTVSKCSASQARALARFCEDQTIQFLALGFDPDLQWEHLPRNIRELIIKRCTGQEENLTRSQHEWLVFNHARGIPIKTFMTRCNFGAYVAMSNRRYALGARNDTLGEIFYHQDTLTSLSFLRVTPPVAKFTTQKIIRSLKVPFSTVYHNLGIYLKLLAIAFVAEPEFQRELNYAIHKNPKVVRNIIFFFATGVWKYTRSIQQIVMPIFLLHGRKNVSTLWHRIGGTTVSLKRQRIAIENTDGISTAFIHPAIAEDGAFEVHQYAGEIDKEPEDNCKLQRISTYSKAMLLLRREDFTNGAKGNVYEYEYLTENGGLRPKRLSKIQSHRYPMLRKCIEGKDACEEVNFNYRGLVQSGSYILHGSLIRFSCHYRQGSNFDDELLRAEFVLPHLTCTVSWSAPPPSHPEKLDKWIPHSQIMEATFVLGSDVYESHWRYDHKFDPTISTTLNGESIETPPIIRWDHLGVLKKPTRYSFHYDDPLITFRSIKPHAIPRWLGLNIHQNPVSTSRARSRLWMAWKNTPGFDGVIVRWLDERLLRREPLLRTYWSRRDRGDLPGAEAFLNENADSVMAAVDLDNSISGWAPLAIKIADLYSFGQGGDANSRTRSKDPDFDNDGLQVLAVDSGTWPNEGGGVSACRRDMINNLRSVSWHMIAESANDFGLPKHQTEMNVRSLKVIPLWGLDFLTPTHGLFRDRLDTEVEHVPRDATKADVKRNFLPILTALVKGARTSHFTKADIMQTTRALVNLNTYFSESKHWGAIWTSRTVKDAWRELWISQDLVSPTPSESWFQTEIPTVAQLDGALELWFRYLFIFSIPVPDRIPAIFQASHHSVSASYGIVCKIKRGCTLQIWDHAISWRETNLYLSSDLCTVAPFVRNSLLGLMRITSQLILHHADTILPCADFFNPGWEIEIGTSQGSLEHRNTFKRKIDPVVNGIPDMSKFAPIKEISSTLPTVTMLSHVWYAKDIKTAILSADIIVNEWHFTDYRLDIYGAIDKAPSYSTDCFEIIASKSLPRFVVMRGEANPTTVLEKTWVFLNSSISEGLPLALGEAALTGAPVVCTDVGASLRVLTDQDTGERYSAVVAPNDARNLARAQINFLAMLDEWAPYANDPSGFKAPTITDKPTKEEVAAITKRMYEKTAERKALGMRSRAIVQKAFGGERYLREHEQMLWIGKSKYDLIHRPPPQPLQRPKLLRSGQSMPMPSTVWGTASTSSMMTAPSSALMTPGVRSLFDVGSGSRPSKASTLFSTQPPSMNMLENRKSGLSASMPALTARAMPQRVQLLKRDSSYGYESSERSSSFRAVMTGIESGRERKQQEAFVRDVSAALQQV
ncbi:glycosyltransferase family 4 protein [Mollisia scopiformis]|uniref:Glycosyltransferase family 4 protein n=1 Tax=Mollisia scopiformis TaxID=149040 RepID=A0A194XJJ8_MOLSC|nr:glycosyltransferase family 4 protein [Mollisia scopiformis]KUJ20420.1 glycosyltransferase family 4 protein [Mollisia scopiformis]